MKEETVKKLKVFATASVLAGSIVLLPGCFSHQNLEDYTDASIAAEYERRNEEGSKEQGEKRIFEPGKHVIMIHQNSLDAYGFFYSDGVRWVIPEGYEVAGAMDQRFILVNNVTVEVIDDGTGEFKNLGTPLPEKEIDATDAAKVLRITPIL